MSQSRALTILSRRLPEKRAFITGAASGLGPALGLELARDAWQLGLLDLSADRLRGAEEDMRAAGAKVWTCTGDVADEPFVAASVADFVAHAGGLDLMINNAGVAVAGAVGETAVDDWRWIVDINLLETMRAPRSSRERRSAHRLAARVPPGMATEAPVPRAVRQAGREAAR